MNNQSDNSFYDEDKDNREQQVSRFKENTLRIRSLMQNSIDSVSSSPKPKKKPVENKVYMIHLSEVSTDGKYCMEYSKTLSQFDFLSLIEDADTSDRTAESDSPGADLRDQGPIAGSRDDARGPAKPAGRAR